MSIVQHGERLGYNKSGIYRYVDKLSNKTVYVGKAKELRNRHYLHIRQGDIQNWFNGNDYELYIIEPLNDTDSEILETVFINYYNPENNKYKRYETLSSLISVDDELLAKWKLVKKPIYKKNKERTQNKEDDLVAIIDYLNSVVYQKLFKDQRKKIQEFLIERISSSHYRSIGMKTLNRYFSENNIPFTVNSYREYSRKSLYYSERYWIIEHKRREI